MPPLKLQLSRTTYTEVRDHRVIEIVKAPNGIDPEKAQDILNTNTYFHIGPVGWDCKRQLASPGVFIAVAVFVTHPPHYGLPRCYRA